MAYTPKKPSSQDRSITITVPKAKDPYLVDWFQDSKRPGESVNDFLRRNLMKLAKQYEIKKQTKLLEESRESGFKDEMLDLMTKTNFIDN